MAIKVLDKDKIQKQNMGAQIKKEISIMKMIRHRHVVVLREVLASRTKVGNPCMDRLRLSVINRVDFHCFGIDYGRGIV